MTPYLGESVFAYQQLAPALLGSSSNPSRSPEESTLLVRIFRYNKLWSNLFH